MRALTHIRVFVALGLTVCATAGFASAPAAPAVTNSLGMQFRAIPGTDVLFSVWLTRVRDFAAFVAATGYDATTGVYSIGPDSWVQQGANWKAPGFTQSDDHPACGLSWNDAKAFCEWLTRQEQAAGRIKPNQSYRLPTDSEWNAAVGLTAANRDAFPWGDSWPPPVGAGNYAGEEARDASWPAAWTTIRGYHDGFARTSPVGSFATNRYGLYDLSGNVWQWGEDPYGADGDKRVVHGGSFKVDAADLFKLSRRGDGAPDSRYVHRRFRCVLTQPVAA